MSKNKGQPQTTKQTNSDETEEVIALQSRIELLAEQIESLKLELSYKDTQIQELEENQRCIHEHLHSQNRENHILCVENEQLRLALSEALSLAQKFFSSNQQSIKYLAILFSKIITSLDKFSQLDKQDKLILHYASKNHLLEKYSANFAKFQTQFNELGSRFVSLKAQIMRLKSESKFYKKEKANQHPPSRRGVLEKYFLEWSNRVNNLTFITVGRSLFALYYRS